MFANIPEVKLGIIAVSRGCFPMALSERRRAAIKAAYGEGLYECPVTVENELDARRAVEDVQAAGVNALVVFLGNFGPETPETLIAEWFSGPIMYAAAAEGDGDLHDGRGDAYCGMLNCSYNLGLRGKTAYIPEYPVGTAPELAEKVAEFVPIARAILGLRGLKLITFGPRPDDFLACNGPIKALYDLGVAVEENSELDLLVAYNKHADDPRIPAKMAEMQAELGGNNKYAGVLPRLAQYELTLLDWAEAHKGARQYVAFANKCWPAFQTEFKFVPCYVNSRLAAMGIPVSCEVDIYGALSEYIGVCVSGAPTTLLDINNTVPASIYDKAIRGRYDVRLPETFMGFHCGNTSSCDAERPAHGLSAHHETRSGAGAAGAGHHTRHHGRQHQARRYHVLPSAVHRGHTAEGIRRAGTGAGRGLRELRLHRSVCHSGDGPLLPPCTDCKALPAPRRGGVRPLGQGAV